MTDTPTDFQKFDAVVRKMVSVPREELKKRERAWKKRQARKRAKTSTRKTERP